MNDPVTAGAEAAPAPVDLSGIDPIHWAEARRRVAILSEWCAKKRHSRAQAVDAAGRMGVSVKHFERLVVTWKRFGDARRISGSAARRGDPRGTFAMPAATRAVIDEAIAALGPTVPFTQLLAEVNRRCLAAGTPSASYGMVHYVHMRARAAPPFVDAIAPIEVRVARVACLLPVADGGGTIPSPELVLAVSSPNGVILSHRPTLDGDLASAAFEVISEVIDIPGSPVIVAANLASALDGGGLAGALARVQIATASELLTYLLGSHIDSIPIRHRRSARIRAWPAEPLGKADARLAIDQAVAAHNRGRTTSAG